MPLFPGPWLKPISASKSVCDSDGRSHATVYELNFSEPFTNLPLRPPGKSLRLQIEKLTSDFDEALVMMFVGSAVASGILVGNLKLWPIVLFLTCPLYIWGSKDPPDGREGSAVTTWF
jgi:hypothetical protein